MKRHLMILVAAALPLGACAGGYGMRGGVAYDGYYDNYYGPIYDGYWGAGDTFYYRAGRGGPWVADRDHHFRRDGGGGYHHVEGMGHPPRGQDHGYANGRDRGDHDRGDRGDHDRHR